MIYLGVEHRNITRTSPSRDIWIVTKFFRLPLLTVIMFDEQGSEYQWIPVKLCHGFNASLGQIFCFEVLGYQQDGGTHRISESDLQAWRDSAYV